MSDYKFSPAQRAAIFTVHGEKCYMCGVPLSLKTMEVDHVIPEVLLVQPDKLAATLGALGRPPDFEINSFANWLPSCGPCNGSKKELIFEPSLILQVNLQKAAAKAERVAAVAARSVSEKKIFNALNVLERAHVDGQLDAETVETLASFVSAQRSPEMAKEPVRISPLYEVLSDTNGLQLVRGPFGIGGRPSTRSAHSSFGCPNCGEAAAWNGARCVICGQLSED
jgi:hypothetical protein